MSKHSPLAFLFLLLVLAAVAGSARAQSIALSPAVIREKFKPGVPFEVELATLNSGGAPVELSVQITDLWYNDKNEKVFSDPGSSPRSAANWIQFVPERFQVGPHGTQKMKAIITPPLDARGGYYATLFVISKPQLSFDKTRDGKQVYTNMRLGCLVLLSAEGTEDYKIELSNISLTPPASNQGMVLTFDLANRGNTHVLPRARVAVLDSNRKLVAKAESDQKRFLPGQKDSMHVDWSGQLGAGNYTAVLSVAYAEDRVETQQIPFTIPQPQR
jgi:hypothetical protein